MKKIFAYILAAGLLALAVSSCWKEPQYPRGESVQGRHQVTALTALAGDEQVTLSWAVPEGWNPTDFQISYVDDQAAKQSLKTGNVHTYTVTGLVNDVNYNFEVQAIYGDIYSGAVKASAKPVTSRFPVVELTADAESQKVTLKWVKPVANVTGYEITYSAEGVEPKTIQVTDKEATSYVVEGLTDDITYSFSVVAKYPNGNSVPVVVKAMPAFSIPYTIDKEATAVGLPVTFTFNRSAFPSATDVQWTLNGDEVLTGDQVKGVFRNHGTQTAVLSAKVDGNEKKWNITVEVREFVVYDNDFPTTGSYNGFKGSAPVFSPDGKTVYDITFSSWTNLIAWDVETGAKKWVQTIEHGSYNGLTVNPVSGDIYFGTQTAGDFFCYSSEGVQKWQFKEAGSMQSASPAVSKDGSTVFIIDATGNTFAIDAATGEKKWSQALGAKGAGLLVNGNELVVATNATSKTINWLSTADGSILKSYDQAQKASDICGGFGVSPDKRYAYYGGLNGAVSKIDLQEKTVVVDCKIIGTNNMWGVVVSPNGDVFFGSKESKAFLVDGDKMELKAEFDPGIGANNGFNYARACSDVEGNFFVSTGQIKNTNYMLGPDLKVKDSFQVGGDGDKQMGGNNYLDGILYAAYIGKSADNGKFVGKYIGGAARYSGPGLDICGSNCIQ